MKISPLLWSVLLLSMGVAPLPLSPAMAQPATIAISPDHPEQLRDGILAAFKAGQKKVVVPAGFYKIPSSNTGANLEFADLKDFEIDATGATFLMQDNSKGGVYFRGCQNVTLRGAIIRNAVFPLTQGTIAAIAPDRKSFELQIDAGYPATLDDPKAFDPRTTYYIFDRVTRRLKNGTYDYGSAGVARLAPDRFNISFDNPLGNEVEVGELSSMRGRGSTGLHNDNCANMHILGVSLQSSGGFGFFETGGDGANSYNGVSVKPGPKPEGAKADPLMSENADGFHSAGVKRGPIIENSMFTRMPDDGIAIHGEYQMVRSVEGATITCMRLWPGAPYTVGDRVAWVRKNGVPGGEAFVTAIKPLADGFLPPIETEFPHFRDNKFFFQLTLDKPLDAHEGDVVSNLDHTGDGFVLRNNTILDHRARGLLLKARDGIVENNLIDGSSIAGIVIGPELWWGEANYAKNVIIRGNTITHCGYATTGPWNEQAGALTILGTGDSPDARGHSHITIENNSFVSNDGINVVLDGLENSTFKNNKFLNAQQTANNRGKDRGIDTGALVWVNRAKNIQFEGNVVQRLGAANTGLIKASPKASEIIGIETGIRVNGTKSVSVPNPLDLQYMGDGAMRREVRDPAIIREGDTYYMTFTMWPFANREDDRMKLENNGSSPGIQLFSSKDLKTWKPENWLVKSADLPVDIPYKHRFWAPEIHKFGAKFYLIFTADNWLKPEYNTAGNWGAAGHAFVGVADKITGPYKGITYIPEGACDTTLFQAADGSTYAVMPKYDIFIRKIDLSNLGKGVVKWLGPEQKIVTCDDAGTLLNDKPRYLEGPWVERVGSRYVLFHAETFDNSYWTSAAYADNPLGPWTKDPRGKVFEGGHLAVFNGPDGRKWFSYRREQNTPERGTPAVDPIDFDAQGRVLTSGPS
ncbi:hypothetical protein EON83_12270 [bacterium]|nr:MAG: hypothetical protein EON83_12270 [bacterium]